VQQNGARAEGQAEAEAMAAPGPDYVIQGGDILWFAGDAAGVQSLRSIPGLAPQTRQAVPVYGTLRIRLDCEIYIRLGCELYLMTC
jgi:hypothetical protein